MLQVFVQWLSTLIIYQLAHLLIFSRSAAFSATGYGREGGLAIDCARITCSTNNRKQVNSYKISSAEVIQMNVNTYSGSTTNVFRLRPEQEIEKTLPKRRIISVMQPAEILFIGYKSSATIKNETIQQHRRIDTSFENQYRTRTMRSKRCH